MKGGVSRPLQRLKLSIPASHACPAANDGQAN